jgi:hypothetical protein
MADPRGRIDDDSETVAAYNWNHEHILLEEVAVNIGMPEIAIQPRIDKAITPQPAEGQTISEVPLRVKGFLAFAAVVIYAVLLTTFTFNKKAELVNEFEHLQDLYKVEDGLRQVDATAFHIVMAVFMNPKPNDHKALIQRFMENFEILKKKNAELTMHYPIAGVNLAGLEQSLIRASAHPSAEGLAEMNAELLKVKIEITQHIDESTREQKATAESFLPRCCSD